MLRRAGNLGVLLALAAALVAPAAYAETAPDPKRALRELNVEAAWQTTKGAGVTVAVLSSGVDGRIGELRGRVTGGPDMRSPRLETGGKPGDVGTAIASLVAGGTMGVAPEARLLSLPVIADSPFDGKRREPAEEQRTNRDNPLARAIRYAANHGADVITMSVGGYGALPAEREAVAYALRKGVVLVASAGDDGEYQPNEESGTSYWRFPAGYSGVIGVAAVDAEGLVAPFSSDNLSVLVAAPGVEVPVALPGGRSGGLSGSSVSAALVSGVVALIKSAHPKLSPEMVARALAASTRGKPAAGYDNKVGFGVVDAAAALAQAGRLSGYDRTIPVPGERHFGAGPLTAPPVPPGPDLLRLWVYSGGVLVGLVLFGAAVVVITRRAEQRRAQRS